MGGLFYRCVIVLLRYVYLYAILRGHIKALYYNWYINTLHIYMIILVVYVAYMGYGCMFMYCYVHMLDSPIYDTRDYIQDVYIKGVLL